MVRRIGNSGVWVVLGVPGDPLFEVATRSAGVGGDDVGIERATSYSPICRCHGQKQWTLVTVILDNHR